MTYKLICSDNVIALNSMAENSVDCCITDPPYGMEIAGVGWDKNVPPVATWQAVHRVLKPGAFVLSFCNPEFYHRMAVNVEDAGFRPMDMILWMNTTKMAKANRLKPAHEPIFVAQKPLEGSIEGNVAKWGCGKINIDAGRVEWEGAAPTYPKGGHTRRSFGDSVETAREQGGVELVKANEAGRYPSNIIGEFEDHEIQKYFYAPRVSRRERGDYNDHPTPKPIDLMRYLAKIYAPVGGTILDPFMGSGSTGIGALLEGREFIGMEQSEHYVAIAHRRILEHTNQNS